LQAGIEGHDRCRVRRCMPGCIENRQKASVDGPQGLDQSQKVVCVRWTQASPPRDQHRLDLGARDDRAFVQCIYGELELAHAPH